MEQRTLQQNKALQNTHSICYIESMEAWKEIPGYSNYEVSTYGNVRAKEKYVRWKHHGKEGLAHKKAKLIKGTPRKMSPYTTYLQVGLTSNGVTRSLHIHRLVALAFIPNPNDKPQVNHIDGNGENNHATNLEWASVSENGIHAYRVLNRRVWSKGKSGENMPTSRPVLQLDLEGNLIKRWSCGLDAVRECNFESSGISRAAQGKIKTHRGYRWQYE